MTDPVDPTLAPSPNAEGMPVVSAAASEPLTDPDVDALKAWARLGMVFDLLLGLKSADGVQLNTLTALIPDEGGGVLLVLRGLRKKERLKTFCRDRSCADALHRFHMRWKAGSVDWRPDPLKVADVQGANATPSGLPPCPLA